MLLRNHDARGKKEYEFTLEKNAWKQKQESRRQLDSMIIHTCNRSKTQLFPRAHYATKLLIDHQRTGNETVRKKPQTKYQKMRERKEESAHHHWWQCHARWQMADRVRVCPVQWATRRVCQPAWVESAWARSRDSRELIGEDQPMNKKKKRVCLSLRIVVLHLKKMRRKRWWCCQEN